MFANCSKNQNKVLKCVFKSSWVLGFAIYWGLCKKKIPHVWGNTKTLKCTISKVPTSAWGPPLGEADDKCITKWYIFQVTHPNTNPAGQSLTSVKYCITKLLDSQSARLNLW